MRRYAAIVTEAVLPLVLVAAALGLLFPSSALAARTDLLMLLAGSAVARAIRQSSLETRT